MQITSLTSSLAVVAAFLLPTARAVSLPNCQAVAPNQTVLNGVRTSYVDVPEHPFGLVYGPRGRHAFVSLDQTLGVLDTTTFTPRLIHQIQLPHAYVDYEGANSLTLTNDGRHILVAAGQGALIVSVARAIQGSQDAVVGMLNSTTPITGNASIEVTLTHDDQYAFVSQEYGTLETQFRGDLQVFKLHEQSANGSIAGSFVGYLTLGYAVVGTALSPDGRTLYALSETTTHNDTTPGVLSIIDVATLKRNPSQALLSNTQAGCGPVRVLSSSNGKTVWVTARESNRLLGFNATKLRANLTDPLIASVQVGTAPVGLTFAKDETRIITADSNRFNYTNTTSGLSVVDVDAALKGKQALLGNIPTGLFPREFAASPDNSTILVADYYSLKVQAVDVASIP